MTRPLCLATAICCIGGATWYGEGLAGTQVCGAIWFGEAARGGAYILGGEHTLGGEHALGGEHIRADEFAPIGARIGPAGSRAGKVTVLAMDGSTRGVGLVALALGAPPGQTCCKGKTF